jgi:hypothetical protein
LWNSHRPHPRVFREPGGAKLWGLPSRVGPRDCELANGMRMSIAVSSQDLSGAWVIGLG